MDKAVAIRSPLAYATAILFTHDEEVLTPQLGRRNEHGKKCYAIKFKIFAPTAVSEDERLEKML